ncbi:MAG TPA: tRNA (adenosine(37)-N6)-threonylcarbamoyltransferase complex dimerization subunit type 1 TsaB [Burkholderiaceae bacterium]|jgi:tRNA threonylcarbamoyladenosine biosynthesis protein TsaB
MSIILAIETSAELASAALVRGQELIWRESLGVQTHSQTILPLVQELLAAAGITVRQCDAIAFGSGPGSFTGVRTACGIVQGLAFGADVPVIPVVTLEAMAEACRAECGATNVLSVLDARMGEVYWSQYRYDGAWHVVSGPSLTKAEAIEPVGQVVACGNGLAAYASAFAGRDFAERGLINVVPHAREVAQLALAALAAGRTIAARDAQPLYLRNKVALTTIERAEKAEAAV